MENKLVIIDININRCRIDYKYEVSGEWEKYFLLDQEFFIEYNIDVSSIPQSIAVIPFLANILPVAWVCDAEILVPSCDQAFYDGIEKIKMGYRNMFPQIDFKGKLIVERIEENHPGNNNGCIAFFSGGVDAFNTLVQHANEHPTLITLWGADIKHSDETGWNNVVKHIEETSSKFAVDNVTAKTCFRMFLNERALDELVENSGDQWYHGFQCGMGIISHAAPISYIRQKNSVYFASSYTSTDEYTSASDPSIDNHVLFGDAHTVHDGYEFSRQMKIHNIVDFSNNTNISIPLRVCWASEGGSNCCTCEKCWRTILGLYAEKANPLNFGFNYDDFSSLCKKMHRQAYKFNAHGALQFYNAIMRTLHENYSLSTIEPNLRWFYQRDVKHLGDMPFYYYILRDLRIKAGAIKYYLLHG